MWPWGYLGFGYLLCWPVAHLNGNGSMTDSSALLLALRTQLPDLVDKPLVYQVAVLPECMAERAPIHSSSISR